MPDATRVMGRICVRSCLTLIASFGALYAARGDAEDILRRAGEQSQMLMREGRYEETGTVLRDALKAARDVEPDNPWLALVLNNLGAYYQDTRDCEDGKAAFRRSLKIWEHLSHPMLFNTAVNLGSLLLECGQLREADRMWKDTLEVRARALPETDPRLGRALVFRANLLTAQKQYAEAEPVAERALAIWQKQFGPEDPINGMMLNALSLLHSRLGRHEEAIAEVRRALDLAERSYGPAHPVRARLYANLSNVEAEAGRYDDADRDCRKALEIAAAAFGPDSPLAAEILLGRADLLKKEKRKSESAAARRHAEAILESAFRHSSATVDVTELAR